MCFHGMKVFSWTVGGEPQAGSGYDETEVNGVYEGSNGSKCAG